MVGNKEPVPLSFTRYPAWRILDEVKRRLSSAPTCRNTKGRPFVTLSYAQSLDGSIASLTGQPLALSSAETMTMTHALRASHDSILVGIGCILADNPRLTVRLTPGRNPQPVVLDSRLRCPTTANLLTHSDNPPWIITTDRAGKKRQQLLEAAGARVIRLRSPSGTRVDLSTLLETLAIMGIDSIMVEGGAQIITSFLADRLIDQIVVTIAPLLVGGLRAVQNAQPTHAARPAEIGDGGWNSGAGGPFPRLINTFYERVGDDLVIRGDPDWVNL